MRKKRRCFFLSERGDSPYISSFVYTLAVVILLAFIINVFHVISMKQEMNHITNQIVKQVPLNGGNFMDGMEERITLSNEDYMVENIYLQFNQYSGKIEYLVACDGTFRIQMFGELFPPIPRHITLTSSHNTKY